jgi:phosphoglycerate dehydrogenase-like enzyme
MGAGAPGVLMICFFIETNIEHYEKPLLLTFITQNHSMQDLLCICGAGTMGSGIARAAAQHGLTVILYDPDPAMLSKAQLQAEKDLQEQVEKKRISEA